MAWQAIIASIGRAANRVASAATRALNVAAQTSAARAGGLTGLAQQALMGQAHRVSAIGGLSDIARNAGLSIGQGAAIGGAVGGPAGAAVGAVTAVASEMVTLPAKFRDLGASVLEASRNMSQLNGSLASAYARLDAERFRRNVRIASETSGSTKRLTESQNRLEEALRPGQVALTNLGNNALAALQDLATTVVEAIQPVVDGVNWIVENGPWNWAGGNGNIPNANNLPPLVDLINRINQGQFAKPMRPKMGPVFVPTPKAGP